MGERDLSRAVWLCAFIGALSFNSPARAFSFLDDATADYANCLFDKGSARLGSDDRDYHGVVQAARIDCANDRVRIRAQAGDQSDAYYNYASSLAEQRMEAIDTDDLWADDEDPDASAFDEEDEEEDSE